MKTSDHKRAEFTLGNQMARADGAKMARESAGIFRDWVVVGHRRLVGDPPLSSGFVALGDP